MWNRQSDKVRRRPPRWLVLLWLLAFSPCLAQTVVFHLRNGDRITGTVIGEKTNEVAIATPFGSNLVIPLGQIERREMLATNAAPAKTAAPPATNAPASQPPAPAPKAPGAAPKPTPPVKPTAAAPPDAKVAKTNQTSNFQKFLADWKGNLDLGLNLGFSSKNRQAYTGRFQATHAHAMPNAQLLKNSLDYIFSYGRIDGVLSDNRMDGSWKTEYEIGKRFSVYNATGAGYDEIRKVDVQFDLGPGIGYKWITRTNFVLATEVGGNYQRQYFTGDIMKQRYSLRLGEESWWQISGKLRLDEKLEFFPEITHFSEFRVRAESNLSYALRNNLTLKFTVIDLYEDDPPPNVSKNDLQIRSSLSIKF